MPMPLLHEDSENDDFVVETMENPRLELVRRLTDLIALPPGQMSPNDREFVADILVSTLEQVTDAIRKEASKRLCGFAELPLPLLRLLLTDEPEIAVPLLRNVSEIPEYLLVEAVARSPEHRKEIAFRKDLTPNVVDAMVNTAEIPILRRIIENMDVAFSESSLITIVRRCQFETEIREAVLKRPELRLNHAYSMFWWLDSKGRKTVLSRFSTDRSRLQEALQDLFRETFTSSTPDPVVMSMLKLIDRRHRPRGKDGEMVTMDVVKKTLEVARIAPNDELAHAVGLLAGITTETAARILQDFSGEAFAILCKSIGLARSDFFDLYNLEGQSEELAQLAPDHDEEKIDQLQGVFDSISRDYARTVLRYWDWRGKDIAVLSDINPEFEETDDAVYLGAV